MAALPFTLAWGQVPSGTSLSRDTSERVLDAGWWPTKGTAAPNEYAGSAACAGCHRGIAETQAQTPMFNAASRPADSSILHKHPSMIFLENNLSYALGNYHKMNQLTVENSSGIVSASVVLAVGNGEVGQTYLLKQKDSYFEGRLSYFTELHGLAVTPGQSTAPPANLQQSLGAALDPTEAARCFGCHTTASTVSGRFEPERSTPGVKCEACHGPGAAHIVAVKQRTGEGNNAATILDPGRLSPVDSVDFCGACHRTPVDVAAHMSPDLGIVSIRFQPYRLERSLCWGASGDPRITCIACHDPHKPLMKDTASYDANCLQCHAVAGRPASAKEAAACKVASKDCASCHMPKYRVEPAHASFTDHYIHVVRAGNGYRD